MLSAKEQELLDALQPHAIAHGVDILTVEVLGSKRSPTVRVYLDAPGGVSFDVITKAQEWLNNLMDSLDPFPGAYVLEVSSPGIDRPLRTPEHFQQFIGKEARVQTSQAIQNRKTFTGDIAEVSAECVTIVIDNEAFELPFSLIKRANLVGKIDFSRK